MNAFVSPAYPVSGLWQANAESRRQGEFKNNRLEFKF
jgi:hypothetical protein